MGSWHETSTPRLITCGCNELANDPLRLCHECAAAVRSLLLVELSVVRSVKHEPA